MSADPFDTMANRHADLETVIALADFYRHEANDIATYLDETGDNDPTLLNRMLELVDQGQEAAKQAERMQALIFPAAVMHAKAHAPKMIRSLESMLQHPANTPQRPAMTGQFCWICGSEDDLHLLASGDRVCGDHRSSTRKGGR